MKKTFIKVTLFSLLAFGATSSLVSCKDYDDDITNIGQVNDEQAKQLSALETALKAAQAAADAAAQKAEAAQQAAQQALAKGDQALAAAQTAEATAARAEQAANQAKADAIKAAQDAVAAALKNVPTQEDLNKLSTSIAAIEKNLNTLSGKVDNAQQAIEQMQIQISALMKYQAEIEKLPQALQTLAEVQTTVGEIQNTIAAIQQKQAELTTQVGTNTQNIAKIEQALNEVSEEVAKIEPRVLTLISRRLTSVTLMPTVYVDGIPTIEFLSAKYTELGVSNPKTYIVSNGKNPVEYRLNPAGIKATDIELNNLSFVTRTATSRATEEAAVINVASASVDNGVLTVMAGKANIKSLNLSGNKIYTVSLRVPLAADVLAKDETNAAVYSEYSRLEEAYFQPMLHANQATKVGQAVPSNLEFFTDKAAIYAAGFDPEDASSLIAVRMAYDTTLNLDDVVAGWGVYEDTSRNPFFMSHEDLAGYGFDITYEVAPDPYESKDVDRANQQKYAKIDGTILTPVTPTGVTGNKAIIGKQPIIKATLIDVNNGNKIVAIKYFKVFFKALEIPDQNFTVETDNVNVSCADVVTVNVNWTDFTANVLEKFNNGEGEPLGISKEDFFKIYGDKPDYSFSPAFNATIDVDDIKADVELPGGGVAAVPVMTWKFEQDEYGHIDFGSSKTYTATITFIDPKGLYPNVVITWKLVISNPESLKLDENNIGETDPVKWTDEVMKVVPVPMPVPYDGTTTAEYSTNILEGRMGDYPRKNYIEGTNILSCAQFGIELSKKYISQYNGSALAYTTTPPMALNTFNMQKEILFNITNNSAGIALVENEKKIQLDWYTDENGLPINEYVFFSNYLQIVKPLTFEAEYKGSKFIDSSVKQTRSLVNPTMWKITDCYGKNVSNLVSGEPADLWKYYVVEGPVFDESDIWLSDTNSGTGSNLRTPGSVNMTADIDSTTGELSFQNNGSAIASNVYIRVKMSFTHKWGKATMYIFVPLEKKI